MPAMQYFPKARSDFKPPLVANENAYLGDVASSEPTSPSTPISGGFYRFEAGTPLDYTYSYDEIRLYSKGTFVGSFLHTMHSHRSKSVEYTNAMRTYTDIKDETGTEVQGEKGDVFLFPKGSEIIFRTDEYGLAFFVGGRKKDTL